jgi:hypothetical protein
MKTERDFSSANPTSEDLSILNEILSALQRLDPDRQQRILNTVATFLGIAPDASTPSSVRSREPTSDQQPPLFSEDRSISPKQFIFEKQPKTDIERVACLAYYLTHYRDLPHFKTLDVSKLNTEAAQVKFANPTVAVDNATKRHFLVPASKGTKQLTALGEQYVLALPDRERARGVMESGRPRRKGKRVGQHRTSELQ